MKTTLAAGGAGGHRGTPGQTPDRAEHMTSVLTTTDRWRSAFPGAVVGALVVRGVRNPEESPALEAAKRGLETELRAAGDADNDPIMPAYADYYRPTARPTT